MDERSSYEAMPDEELVRHSLKDPDSFYFLIKRYEPKILGYIKRITKISPQESEDLLQDIFIKVYRNLNRFNRRLKFSSWIYRIAHNEIITQYRKKKVYAATMNLYFEKDETGHLAGFVGDAFDIDKDYISRENAENVKRALMALPEKYREVLILRYFEDHSYKEISDILRKPAGTVASLVNRAKTKFRKIALHYQLEDLI